ncbi:MAG: FkbM family methyltransferase [Campylobacterota bacterium]|nr:FkbM family methyltransferase [Campylobacterota bacterium]
MKNIINSNYINEKDKYLVEKFIKDDTTKKYILGINKLTKSVLKHIEVDGIIDDFTRVQNSKKRDILKIEDVPKNSIILWTAEGSPLEVKNYLDKNGYTNISYLSFYRYSSFDLKDPSFIVDFEEDFKNNIKEYSKTYNLLEDKKSKDIFTKVINFKISFDYGFMKGFKNDFEGQYFDTDIVPNINNIKFLDGGGYVGDTLPNIIKNFPDFEKIYLIEPNNLHINIAKRDFGDVENIEFIECGLSNKKTQIDIKSSQHNCNHNYQANKTDTIDNILDGKSIDFIKLDIEGSEQEALDGAIKTIQKYKPILAICIYHKAEDWYKIPQKVLDINSEYKIYLRHYMEGIFETVIYFIPNDKFQ